jgi:hypothetical protein
MWDISGMYVNLLTQVRVEKKRHSLSHNSIACTLGMKVKNFFRYYNTNCLQNVTAGFFKCHLFFYIVFSH